MAKPVTFTKHASTAMEERLITTEWVERTVKRPQWVESDRTDPEVRRAFAALPERDGRYLRVAFVETPTEIRILSAFLDRRARPK